MSVTCHRHAGNTHSGGQLRIQQVQGYMPLFIKGCMHGRLEERGSTALRNSQSDRVTQCATFTQSDRERARGKVGAQYSNTGCSDAVVSRMDGRVVIVEAKPLDLLLRTCLSWSVMNMTTFFPPNRGLSVGIASAL